MNLETKENKTINPSKTNSANIKNKTIDTKKRNQGKEKVRKRNSDKRNKGITLIALVITIITMLILARSNNKCSNRRKWINNKSNRSRSGI